MNPAELASHLAPIQILDTNENNFLRDHFHRAQGHHFP
jgi:hypothetical protein